MQTPQPVSASAPRQTTSSARAHLAVPEPRRFVRVDGVSIAIHDTDPSGTRPCIVCLHAVGHGGGDFNDFASDFGHKYRVVTIDWPGHGASEADRHPTNAARYADLLSELLLQLSVSRVALFGNSIGGGAAIRVAHAQPSLVSGLVLCNSAGLDPGGLFARLFIDYLLRHFRRGAESDPRFPDWYRRYYSAILLGPSVKGRRAAIVDAAFESAPRLVEAWESFKTPEADLRPHLLTLSTPVFVGWAVRDRLIRWSRNKRAVQSIQNAIVVPFLRSGHAPFLEERDAFNAAVGPFLSALPWDSA